MKLSDLGGRIHFRRYGNRWYGIINGTPVSALTFHELAEMVRRAVV